MMSRLAFADPVAVPEETILAVGEDFSRARCGRERKTNATTFASFAEVTPVLVDALDPEIVISSVLGHNFDCVDLAEKLCEMGFEGRYRLIADGLPRPDVVIKEIRALFPTLRVELE
jgi:hypothetical protein